MTVLPLTRKKSSFCPDVQVIGEMSLAPARVHEFCGPARRTLALLTARAMTGPILWIRPAWGVETLMPDGLVSWAAPGRFLFVRANRPDDLLWTMEEALRSGTVPLVVADLPGPPALTPVRRLHLAAENGATAGAPPLGVLLTPDDGGAQGVESRWRLDPDHDARRSDWRLTRLRARAAPPRRFRLSRTGKALSLTPDRAPEAA